MICGKDSPFVAHVSGRVKEYGVPGKPTTLNEGFWPHRTKCRVRRHKELLERADSFGYEQA